MKRSPKKWSKKEVEKLYSLVEAYSLKDITPWKSISIHLNKSFKNNRSSTACRLKYRKMKSLKKNKSSKRSNTVELKNPELNDLARKHIKFAIIFFGVSITLSILAILISI